MADTESEMELDVWPGDWGLPSVDSNCIAVMAYCKFAKVPIRVNKVSNPWRSPAGTFPLFRHSDTSLLKIPEIFNYLRKEKWGTDFDLSTRQSADMMAFTKMIEEKLVPALLYQWWVESKTYTELTRPWYSKAIPFPFNMYFPSKLHSQSERRLQLTKGGDHMTEDELEQKVYREAKECMNQLSAKLGESDFFFGTAPSSLDALVFGYLAPLLKAPLPSNPLANHLKCCTNLCGLCNRIFSRYFPVTAEEADEMSKKAEEESQRQADAAEFPNKKRNIILAGIVAMTAMVGYAFLNGLIQIEITDVDETEGRADRPSKPPNIDGFEELLDEEDDDAEE